MKGTKLNSSFNEIDFFSFIVLFLTYFNFFNKSTLIFCFGSSLILLYVFIYKKERINKNIIRLTLLVFIFSLSYQMIDGMYMASSSVRTIQRILTPVIAFLLGYLVISKDEEGNFSIKKIAIYLLFIAVISFIYGVIDIVAEYVNGNKFLIDVNSRKVYDIWVKTGLAATIINSKIFLITSIVPIIFYTFYKNKKGLIILNLVFMICCISALKLGSRTFFLGCILNMILSFLVLTTKKYELNIKRIILLLMIITSLTIVILVFNIFNIREILFDSLFFKRIMEDFNLLNDPRIEMWENVIINLPNYPMGGYPKVGNLNYAHNLWLDIALATGVIPLILFLILTVVFMIKIKRLLDYKNIYAIFILSFSNCLLFLYMMEPIISGYYSYFLIFFMMLGSLSGYQSQGCEFSIIKKSVRKKDSNGNIKRI